MQKSFAMLSSDAAGKAAARTRLQFMSGAMSHDEFLSKRARQEITAHNRFETLLARAYPNHKPNLITATVDAAGFIEQGMKEAAE